MYNILALDDDKFILASLQRSLRKQKDWQVDFFDDPSDALEHARYKHYDLFLSDYQMPKIDGLEFLAKVKTLQPDSLRIILSGDDNMDVVEQAFKEVGVVSFINKPVQQQELIATISKAFSNN